MRVGQLSVEVKVEVLVQRKFLVSHLDVSVTSLLDNGTCIYGLQDGIDRVIQVLNEDRVSLFNRGLNGLDDLRVGQSGDLEVVLGLHGLQPCDTLELRINDQTVSGGAGKNSTVFYGHSIGWKLLGVPFGDLGRAGQDAERIGVGTLGDVVLLEELKESGLHNLSSVLLCERSNIRYEGRGQKDISNNQLD